MPPTRERVSTERPFGGLLARYGASPFVSISSASGPKPVTSASSQSSRSSRAAEPGFITMNLPRLLDDLDALEPLRLLAHLEVDLLGHELRDRDGLVAVVQLRIELLAELLRRDAEDPREVRERRLGLRQRRVAPLTHRVDGLHQRRAVGVAQRPDLQRVRHRGRDARAGADRPGARKIGVVDDALDEVGVEAGVCLR